MLRRFGDYWHKKAKMRKTFEQQFLIGQTPIEELTINPKNSNAIGELIMALKEIYCTKEYNSQIFSILEKYLKPKNNTGRPGMNLWQIFVLAELRLCRNLSYEDLVDLANNHRAFRILMGVENGYGYEQITFTYQNIYDNVSQLDEQMVVELNAIVLDFGQRKVFKKKEEGLSHLKTDSYVIESNVHFPTDYNLSWDCARKCLDYVSKITVKKGDTTGWRKINNWRKWIKSLMREVGRASGGGGKNKEQRVKDAAEKYLKKINLLHKKITAFIQQTPAMDAESFVIIVQLIEFNRLMLKHIDLIERRLLKGEKIPHHEKMFSIFEQYTEWINKGKSNPSVELGKIIMITTDQNNLIVDYQILENQRDRDVVVDLSKRVLPQISVASWSFDKGYYTKENKEFLSQQVPNLVMPKLGRKTQMEQEQEGAIKYKRLKNQHSAIESNINELEHRGLDRCPDRTYRRFKLYAALGVGAYNLKKIGKEILKQELARQKLERLKQAA